ncbi:hypothetical protein [Streptomyces griseus]|uniref:hypothetical protein n=1 Tax=Streptomyces griseus TaxID=1911 RepID=UPI0033D1CC34
MTIYRYWNRKLGSSYYARGFDTPEELSRDLQEQREWSPEEAESFAHALVATGSARAGDVVADVVE